MYPLVFDQQVFFITTDPRLYIYTEPGWANQDAVQPILCMVRKIFSGGRWHPKWVYKQWPTLECLNNLHFSNYLPMLLVRPTEYFRNTLIRLFAQVCEIYRCKCCKYDVCVYLDSLPHVKIVITELHEILRIIISARYTYSYNIFTYCMNKQYEHPFDSITHTLAFRKAVFSFRTTMCHYKSIAYYHCIVQPVSVVVICGSVPYMAGRGHQWNTRSRAQLSHHQCLNNNSYIRMCGTRTARCHGQAHHISSARQLVRTGQERVYIPLTDDTCGYL